MSAPEWHALKNNWALSPYPSLVSSSEQMTDYGADTDWRKEISQRKLSQAHNLGFFGRYKKTSYSAMLNFNNYNGIVQKSNNTIYSGQFSLSQLALKDKLQLNITAIGTLRKYSKINDNPYLSYSDPETGLRSSNILSITNHYNPTVPVFNIDGTYGIDGNNLVSPLYNPLNLTDNITDERELKNKLVRFFVNYEIIEGFKFSASYSQYKTTTDNFFSNYYQQDVDEFLSEREEAFEQKEKLHTLKLNYNKTLAFHHLDISLAYSKQVNDVDYENSDFLITNNTERALQSRDYGDGSYNIENLSGTIKYNYNNRYYLNLGILRESTPFYSREESPQYSPSISAAWSLGGDSFLNDIGWLTNLKLSAGYGVGQRQIKFADKSISSSTILPSQDIHGEEMQEYNIGIGAYLFSYRFYFSADYYNRKTTGGIVPVSLSNSFGFSYLANETKISNKGWEFYLKAKPLINKLKWSFDFNISFNENIVNSELLTELNNNPVGNYYGYQFVGYSDSNDRLLVIDNEGNIAEANQEYRKVLGNGLPKSFFGLTNHWQYKNFELSIFLRGAFGFDVKNLRKIEHYGYKNYNRRILSTDQRDIVNYSSLNGTDYFLEKGNYIKIDNIYLGYKIPFNNSFIENAKVYIACDNVAIFTKATEADPENAGIAGLYHGYYFYNIYPETRLFILGLKINL